MRSTVLNLIGYCFLAVVGMVLLQQPPRQLNGQQQKGPVVAAVSPPRAAPQPLDFSRDIQQLHVIVDQQRTEIDQLKARVAALEKPKAASPPVRQQPVAVYRQGYSYGACANGQCGVGRRGRRR